MTNENEGLSITPGPTGISEQPYTEVSTAGQKKACPDCSPKAFLGETDGVYYFQCSCGRNFTGDREDLDTFLARTIRDTPPNEKRLRGVAP